MVSPTWLTEPTEKHAYYLSILGVILEGSFTVMGIAAYFWLGSALLLLYGMQNFVDWLSTVIVLWRFYTPGEMTKKQKETLAKREDRAGVAISALIILMGCLVIPAAFIDLGEGPKSFDHTENKLFVVMTVSFVNVIICTSTTALKLYYAKILESESLHRDGLCSAINLLLSWVIFANSWIINQNPDLWELDAYSAIFCGTLSILLGLNGILKAICVHRQAIFSIKFWRNPEDADIQKDDLEFKVETVNED